MANRTLFEALTGYNPPSQADPLAPAAILGAGGAAAAPAPAPPRDEFERKESDFPAILQFLEKKLHEDPNFAQNLKDALGIEKDPASWKIQLDESQEIVDQASRPSLLGGPSGWSDIEDTLQGPALLGVPADFSDTYVAQHVVKKYWEGLERIDLKPNERRFEDDNILGVLGWLVFNGPEAVTVPRALKKPFPEQFRRIHGAVPFRRHGADQFVHKLKPAAPTRIALFADFGTGSSHSQFIARQLDLDRYHAAISLGDVYYTGTIEQYRNYFEKPLDKVLMNGTELFLIPDNHDGYSGFHAYVDFLDRRTKQKGSYFAIETEHVQFIGVDTIWHSDRGRIQDGGVSDWLRARFAAGRAAGRANVLMTGHHAYDYEKTDIQALNDDVLKLANGALDLWFWGNTHYCALYDRTDKTPYYGSCIGHGGYPYKQIKPKASAKPSAAPVLFAESGSRYEGTTVRKDRGMNGFCAFEIDPAGGVVLRYRDWRGHDRGIAKFSKQADGSLRLTAPVEEHL